MSPPGLEAELCAEARECGFKAPRIIIGGVAVTGGWPEVWRANLELRGCGRVLARIGSFRAMHLAQLDKRARKFPWGAVPEEGRARPCRGQLHALTHLSFRCRGTAHCKGRCGGAGRTPEGGCGSSSSRRASRMIFAPSASIRRGVPRSKRGHKEAVGKAPMRETLASLFLRRCGFDGTEPVVDPMCGSGTFVIEAAERAAGLKPGRSRHFAFEQLASFDAAGVGDDARRGKDDHAGSEILRQRPGCRRRADGAGERRAGRRCRFHRLPAAP